MTSLLDLANDWVLLVDDVPVRIVFPLCTGVSTSERPDIIIYSKSAKIVIWGELTVPLEENIEAASIRKFNKYSKSDAKKNELSLADECRRNGWTVHDFTFEVGSLGWVAHSTRRFLSKLGFKSSHLKWLLKRMSKITMRSSYLIWCCRKERSWEPPELVPLRVTPTTTPDPPRTPSRLSTSSYCQRCNTCGTVLCPRCHCCDTCGLCNRDDKKRDREAKNDNADLIDPKQEAARTFLAARISFNGNPEPNPDTLPRRTPPPKPVPSKFKHVYETLAEEAEDFDALIADAENYAHDQSPPPPDGPPD